MTPRHPAPLPANARDHIPHDGRRRFLGQLLGAGLAAWQLPAAANGPLVFKPGPGSEPTQPALEAGLKLDDIAQSFWQRPRELWLHRQDTGESIRATYWKDGQLHADGYWRICALLRDVRQNVMTTMDPALLDVMRGVLGYYEQWSWPYPLVVTSGFRTAKTNVSLEGAARNSMHLYGRAVDVYLPGIPVRDVARLGQYFQRGGVGFYPDNGFVHLDTGSVRAWSKRRK
jgi:uncharacterized protein YcbK (DUF882 family)